MIGMKADYSGQEQVWDSIARTWHRFRPTAVWEVRKFLEKASGSVLDLGCGSGRNMIPGNYSIYGLDFSYEMLRHARERTHSSLARADLRFLPFRTRSFDFVVFSAALHHVASRDAGKCLLEMKRVMKPGARAMITVWNRHQPMFRESPKECFVPWNRDGQELMRYVRLYSMRELRDILEACMFSKISIRGSSQKAEGKYPKNIIAVVMK